MKFNSTTEYNRFKEEFNAIAKNIFYEINNYLDKYGLKCEYLSENDYKISKNYLGVFASSVQDDVSVFPIALNIKLFYNCIENGRLHYDDLPYEIEKTIAHEVGHGILGILDDVFNIDNLDEEKEVEQFARCYMGEESNCEVLELLKQYYEDCE